MPRVTNNKYKTVHMLSVDEVIDLDTLCSFLNSRCGAPLPTAKDKGAVSKNAVVFFESYPDAEWRALTDLANWSKAKNKHLSMVQLVGSWRYAFEDGFMRILQADSSTNDETTLREMLKSVEDPATRERMINASTATARDEAYQTYHDTFAAGDVDAGQDDPLKGYGLATGQAVKVRLSAADTAIVGTVVGLVENRLSVYLRGQEVPVPFHLVQIRQDGEWIDLL
jgi:hypothetical protein